MNLPTKCINLETDWFKLYVDAPVVEVILIVGVIGVALFFVWLKYGRTK